MVQSLVLLTSFVFIFVNFLVDLINAFVDHGFAISEDEGSKPFKTVQTVFGPTAGTI